MLRYIKRWNIWRKQNKNCVLYKLLVLIGFTKSPTMQWILLDDELKNIMNSLDTSLHKIKSLNNTSGWGLPPGKEKNG